MIDEQAFIHRVEAASPDEFAEILRTVDQDQERALRSYLGDAAFERMRNLALEQGLTRAASVSKAGNVVVLPGILGAELSEDGGKIWVSVLRLLRGAFGELAMDQTGNSLKSITATGVLKKYYGDLLLTLAKTWNVQAYAYDWRADIRTSADQLSQKVAAWFPNQPVHFVAHSMGGLVVRTAMARNPAMWRSTAPGRLIMLGTPNYGSFAIPLLYNGLNDTIKTVANIDVHHNSADLLQIAKMFVGPYQMLPSPWKMSNTAPLYLASTYGELQPPQQRFEDARRFQSELQGAIDTARMIYVAGYNRRTAMDVSDFGRLTDIHSYTMTMRGDGTVPHSLGLLDGVSTFFIDEEHSRLPANPNVLQAINSLLASGTAVEPLLWHGLKDNVAEIVRGVPTPALQTEVEAKIDAHQAEVQFLKQSLQVRGTPAPQIVTPEESRLQDFLFRGFGLDADVGTDEQHSNAQLLTATVPPQTTPGVSVRLRVHVTVGDIGEVLSAEVPPISDLPSGSAELPIDVVAVGHYVGVKPIQAELALDRAISQIDPAKNDEDLKTSELIITEFTERGTLRGELGQFFFLPDPRDCATGSRRMVAIAGMGPVGRFGVPETVVLSRELCWTLSRLGYKHLSTVLIGSGAGNLSIEEGIGGWMRGAYRALADRAQSELHGLEAITFVERNETRANTLKIVLGKLKAAMEQEGLQLQLCDPTPPDDSPLRSGSERKLTVSTRITAELRQGVFRFGAITENASIPEREVPLNPELVRDVNDLIAAERDPLKRSARGEFLRRLVIPSDLEGLLSGSAPIVLACDSDLAQIHWELMSQPRPQGTVLSMSDNFLGLCRGFTRQLLTTFAPVPEPPPPAVRKLRVLIVADTASDMPLPGARTEAFAIQSVLEQLKQSAGSHVPQVEVVTMIGPNEANWALVMEKLLESPPFDVLHYAGHCFYDAQNPARSGWIFSKGNVLSAQELARVDRIPKLVFSNACESGLTPSRAELRSPQLAPSFAEAFFGRGVANFICTAWPVEDAAARGFAIRLYSGLLGTGANGAPNEPEPMYKAMREARRAIMNSGTGRSWGAYQHYGNPFFQLFR